MKETVLGESLQTYSSKIKTKKIICIVSAVLMVGLNVLFTVLRNDDNHTLMLLLNIFTDLIVSWFLIAFINFSLRPMTALFSLSKRQVDRYKGVISDISETTERNEAFDCYKITIKDRIFFLPSSCAIKLKIGETVIISVASNIITEVEHL